MSTNASDTQQQQQQMPTDVVTREEFDAVVRQLALARASQKSIESQLSSEAAAAQYDSMLRQVETNALLASDDGLKILSQALKVALTAVKPLLLHFSTSPDTPVPTPIVHGMREMATVLSCYAGSVTSTFTQTGLARNPTNVPTAQWLRYAAAYVGEVLPAGEAPTLDNQGMHFRHVAGNGKAADAAARRVQLANSETSSTTPRRGGWPGHGHGQQHHHQQGGSAAKRGRDSPAGGFPPRKHW
jgi:hypothetical protein